MLGMTIAAWGLTMAISLAQAANTPPGFDAAKWKELIVLVIKHGRVVDGHGMQFRYLERVSPADWNRPVRVDDLIVTGEEAPNGHFGVSSVVADSEIRIPGAGGKWLADQWEYALAVDGELSNVTRMSLVEDASGHIISSTALSAPDAKDPQTLGRWGNLLQDWFKDGKLRASPERSLKPPGADGFWWRTELEPFHCENGHSTPQLGRDPGIAQPSRVSGAPESVRQHEVLSRS